MLLVTLQSSRVDESNLLLKLIERVRFRGPVVVSCVTMSVSMSVFMAVSVSVSMSVHWNAWDVCHAGSASDEQAGTALGMGSVHWVGVNHWSCMAMTMVSWFRVVGQGPDGQSEECQDDELVHGAAACDWTAAGHFETD